MTALRLRALAGALLLLALAAALVAVPGASAQITASPERLVVGQPTTLSFGAPADTVVVTYRPGSRTSSVDTLAAAGASTVSWTPRAAGLVQVGAAGTRTTLSVRFARTPLSGLFVMLGAGLVLFGGAAFALRLLMREDEPAPDPAAGGRRADT